RRATYEHVDPAIQYKNFEEAAKHLHGTDIHTIVQTELFADSERNDEILAYAQEHHIAYRFVPGNSSLFTGSIEVNLFEGIPTIAVHQTALTGWGRIVKRGFDVTMSFLALVLVSPLILLLIVLAKAFNPKESVFFTQTRLSR